MDLRFPGLACRAGVPGPHALFTCSLLEVLEPVSLPGHPFIPLTCAELAVASEGAQLPYTKKLHLQPDTACSQGAWRNGTTWGEKKSPRWEYWAWEVPLSEAV